MANIKNKDVSQNYAHFKETITSSILFLFFQGLGRKIVSQFIRL